MAVAAKQSWSAPAAPCLRPEYRVVRRDGLWRVVWSRAFGVEEDSEVFATESAAEACDYIARVAELDRPS
jgi:hypothetical protein